MVLQIIRRAMLELHRLDFATCEMLKKELTISNPTYEAAIRFRRFATPDVPKKILLYQEHGDVLSIPRNLQSDLLEQILVSNVVQDKSISRPTKFGVVKIDFRHYQQRVIHNTVSAIQTGLLKDGIIVAPAGSGKTTILLEIARQLGQRTLWLTDEISLAKQTLKRAKDQFGISGALWGAGNHEIAPFTVAIYDSLQNEAFVERFADEFGLILVDVCNLAPASTYSKVINHLNAKYRLGTTATPKRKDGLHTVMFQTLGPIIEKVARDDLKEFLVTSRVWFIKSEFRTTNKTHKGIEKAAYKDKRRNQLIVDKSILIVRERNHKLLILTGTKLHANQLQQLLNASEQSFRIKVVTSDTPYEEREVIYEAARSGEVDILIAVKIARKGLDVPNLSALLKVRPSNNDADLEQEVGRISRFCPGKPEPEVFDIADVHVDLLKNQALNRLDMYKELDCIIPTNKSEAD